MKLSCPKCGRSTQLEDSIGDFPTRCTCCGAMLRRRGDALEATHAAPEGPRATRISRGTLAGLLISQTTEEDLALAGTGHGVLRPESRRAVARAHARQQALLKAELRGKNQALGALTWAGLVLASLLFLGAVAMKAQATFFRPAPQRADVLRVGEN